MAYRCKDCGSYDLVLDNHETVCRNCGLVNDDVQYVMDFSLRNQMETFSGHDFWEADGGHHDPTHVVQRPGRHPNGTHTTDAEDVAFLQATAYCLKVSHMLKTDLVLGMYGQFCSKTGKQYKGLHRHQILVGILLLVINQSKQRLSLDDCIAALNLERSSFLKEYMRLQVALADSLRVEVTRPLIDEALQRRHLASLQDQGVLESGGTEQVQRVLDAMNHGLKGKGTPPELAGFRHDKVAATMVVMALRMAGGTKTLNHCCAACNCSIATYLKIESAIHKALTG